MQIRPKNPLLWIKYKFLEYKWDRVLKRSGCDNWEIYFRKNDLDYWYRGQTVKEQFCGYPHVALVSYKHLECNIDTMWGEMWNGNAVAEWCKQHCRGKFRWQWERVTVDHLGQYTPNGVGGTDELFFGFKDERDYMLFLLRWP